MPAHEHRDVGGPPPVVADGWPEWPRDDRVPDERIGRVADAKAHLRRPDREVSVLAELVEALVEAVELLEDGSGIEDVAGRQPWAQLGHVHAAGETVQEVL